MLFTLKFLKQLPLYETVQPYKLYGFPELSASQKSNCVYEAIDNVHAIDVRSTMNKFRFEVEGFEFAKAPTKFCLNAAVLENETDSAQTTIHAYLQETMDFVKKRLKASRVLTMDWRVQQSFCC